VNLQEIQQIVDEKIAPILKLHAGSCELVGLDGNVLSMRLKGGCVGCPSSTITLYQGIIPILQEKFPDLDVVLV
jgi:Fe-S cluster biogenesis protein NfuA